MILSGEEKKSKLLNISEEIHHLRHSGGKKIIEIPARQQGQVLGSINRLIVERM